MLDDIRLTRAERDLINRAFNSLEQFTRSRWELDQWVRQERKGYGRAGDRVPLIVARALCVKWFRQGVDNPNALLRDAFDLRPAAVYMMGLGARAAHLDRVSESHWVPIKDAVDAYQAAFDAALDRDFAALRAAQAQAQPDVHANV